MEIKRDKDELYQLITENAGDVIWIMDISRGRFSYVSPSVEKLRGYTPDEVLNQSVSDVLTPQSYSFIENNLPLRLQQFYEGDETKRVMTHEMDQTCKDGRIIQTEVVTTLMTDNSGKVVEILGVSRDITERKLAQRQIAKLNEELEQRISERTQQLETSNRELESFTYSVSHDLRSPLRAIHGYSTILINEYASSLNEEGRNLLSVIQSNVVRMDRLITGMLTLARISKGSLVVEKVNMNSLVQGSFDTISSEEEKQGISFNVMPLPDVACDPVLIRQVWCNLISNAIKFTSTRLKRIIEISGKREKDNVTYKIKDNGVGFNPKYTGLLFNAFQRLHKMEEFEGTGVGLAIIQRIISRHGGKVWAEGEEEQGAIFSFSLPG